MVLFGGTLSMLSQAIYNSTLAFILCLSDARGQLEVKTRVSQAFSVHASSPEHAVGLFYSPIYVRAFNNHILPCISFLDLFSSGFLDSLLLILAFIPLPQVVVANILL